MQRQLDCADFYFIFLIFCVFNVDMSGSESSQSV
jgi:hypothetical protein